MVASTSMYIGMVNHQRRYHRFLGRGKSHIESPENAHIPTGRKRRDSAAFLSMLTVLWLDALRLPALHSRRNMPEARFVAQRLGVF